MTNEQRLEQYKHFLEQADKKQIDALDKQFYAADNKRIENKIETVRRNIGLDALDIKKYIQRGQDRYDQLVTRQDILTSTAKQQDYITIYMTFHIITYYGTGQPPKLYERKEIDYIVVDYNKGKTKDALRFAVTRAYNQLEEKIKRILESNSEIDYISDKRYTLTSKTELFKHALDPQHIKMRMMAVVDYQFVNGKSLNVPKIANNCVFEYLMNTYGPHSTKGNKIMSLTKDKIKEIIFIGKELDTFDRLIGDDFDVEAEERGLSVAELQIFCHHYKISHYAIDISKNIIQKYSYPKSKYRAMMYYSMNCHLYPITCDKTRGHITKVHAGRVISHSTTITDDHTALVSDTLEKRFALPFYEDIPLDKLVEYKNCNIFYHEGNLHDKFIALFEKKNKDNVRSQYVTNHRGDKLSCIKYANNVFLFTNVNHTLNNIDWKNVKKRCEAFGIAFKNQSLPSLAFEKFESFHIMGSRKFLRENITQTMKKEIMNRQDSCCNVCRTKLSIKGWETDHIVPLTSGGSNDIKNLQIICTKPCHHDKTRKEAAERTFKIDSTMSTYNSVTKDIFTKQKNGFIHSYIESSNVQKVMKDNETSQLFGCDINKCRTNIVKYNELDYCVFSILDDVRPFDKIKDVSIPLGYYYITTEQLLPTKGNGWYSYPMIRYCIEQKLITLDDIHYVLIPSLTMKHDYYNNFITYLQENGEEDAKIMFNGFVGILGNKMDKTREVVLCTEIEEASRLAFTHQRDAFVTTNAFTGQDSIDDDKKEKYYEVVFKHEMYRDDSYVPIFNMILDMEAIELHKISKMLIRNNGQMVYTNTDHALALFDNEEDVIECKRLMKKQYWDPTTKKVSKLKEDSNMKEKSRCEQIDRYKLEYKPREYNIIEDPKTNKFKSFARTLINMNQSFQLDGRAGTGKTHLLKTIMSELIKQDKKFICLAPTHKAVKVLSKDAQTINAFFSGYTVDKCKSLSDIDYIIIDEKSFIKELFIRLILNVKRNTNCKFILSGDWAQLRPVADRSDDFDYQTSSAIHYISQGNYVQLDQCRRADDVLYKMCKNVNKVDVSKFKKVECDRSITFHNSFRSKINAKWMNHYAAKADKTIELSKFKSEKKSQDITLYEGLPLLSCMTNFSSDIMNADMYVVKSFDKTHVTICYEGEEESGIIKKVLLSDVTKLFLPAYCITVHSSQGSSFNFPYTIYEWEYMEERMRYVALSRATDIKLINICPTKY